MIFLKKVCIEGNRKFCVDIRMFTSYFMANNVTTLMHLLSTHLTPDFCYVQVINFPVHTRTRTHARAGVCVYTYKI